jgi:DNA repair protein RadC
MLTPTPSIDRMPGLLALYGDRLKPQDKTPLAFMKARFGIVDEPLVKAIDKKDTQTIPMFGNGSPAVDQVRSDGVVQGYHHKTEVSEAELVARGARVRHYVGHVINGTAKANKIDVGVLCSKASDRISKITGLPVHQSMEVVIADNVVHSMKRHPDLTDADWENLPRLTNQFDDVALGQKSPNPDLIRLVVKKIFPDGSGYGCVLAFAPGGKKKRLNVLTYFKGRGKSLEAWWETNKSLNPSTVPNLTEPASSAYGGPLRPSSETIAQSPDKIKTPTLGAKAKRALEHLKAGGFFRKQLHTQYRGGEKFETHLHDEHGGTVYGIGFKTFHELQTAGHLESVGGIPSSSVWRSEWKIRAQAGRISRIADESAVSRTFDTPEFRAWFGDSKVVDAQSKPLVVYHGTIIRPDTDKVKGMGDIAEFDRLFTTKFRGHSIDTVGSWFSTNPGAEGAEMYAGGDRSANGVIYPVHLSINNPYNTTFPAMLKRARLLANGIDDGRMVKQPEVDALRNWLKETGRDGIHITRHESDLSTEFQNQNAWIPLEPTQIKSAIGNNGDYDGNNPVITKAQPRILFFKGGTPGTPGLYQKLITDKHGKKVIHWVKPFGGHAAAHNEAQAELFNIDGTPYQSLETRPDTTDKQRHVGMDAIAALKRRVNLLRASGGSAATLLGARLYASFVASGHNQLTGQKITSPQDLAALAQVYRDPRFETFRCIFLKGDEVVGESAYSSRLPGSVRLPDDYTRQVEADFKRFGATGYYMLHNHTSGSARPSKADENLTEELNRAVSGMKAHVVIDHSEYGLITKEGRVSVIQKPDLAGPDYHSSPSLDHPMLGVLLGGPADVAMAAKALAAELKGGPVLVMTKGFECKVDLIASVPHALMDTMTATMSKRTRAKAWLRGIGRASGAGSHTFLVVSDADYDGRKEALKALIAGGSLTDVVSSSGKSMMTTDWVFTPHSAGVFKDQRPGFKVAQTLASDLEAQEKYLTDGAKKLGYADIDDLAMNDYPAFERLAVQWRMDHPVETALYQPVGVYGAANEDTISKARLLQGKPVVSINLDVAPSGGYAALREWATSIFASQGGHANSPELGFVILDGRSVRDSLFHGGANAYKKAAFAAVKDVLEKGRVIAQGWEANEKSFYVSAPVDISGKADIVTVLVRQDANTNRMYLHSVAPKEYLLNLSVSGADAETSKERTGALSSRDVATVLHNLLNFKLPDESSPVEVVAKSFPRIIFFKGGKPGGAGLHSKLITDKRGRQVTQWVKGAKSAPMDTSKNDQGGSSADDTCRCNACAATSH